MNLEGIFDLTSSFVCPGCGYIVRQGDFGCLHDICGKLGSEYPAFSWLHLRGQQGLSVQALVEIGGWLTCGNPFLQREQDGDLLTSYPFITAINC